MNDEQAMRVALTGQLQTMERKEFPGWLEKRGLAWAARLDAADVLVVGDDPTETRVREAEARGVRTVSWDDFRQEVEGPDAEVEGPDAEEEEKEAGSGLAELLAALRPDASVLTGLSFDDFGTPQAEDETASQAEVSPSEVPEAEALPSVYCGEDTVRIADLVLPRRVGQARAQRMDALPGYTLDAKTVAMLRHIARAVLLAHPCLLEGETATSKTSAVMAVAALAGHRVLRLNLNGQSDTSELIGRYVPCEGGGTGAPGWRFQWGVIPQAMRDGCWVILDELNLAAPSVLERLNPVLERAPSLVLSEGDGTHIGPGGDVPVHPDFRLFATMNPAEYEGRAVLSPAFRDRWVATWQAEAPGELEYRQYLERAAYGVQPTVRVGARVYRGPCADDGVDTAGLVGDADPALAASPYLAALLPKLAKLHAGVVAMAAARGGRGPALGVSQREGYVFSRRALGAVLDALRSLRRVDARGGVVDFASDPEAVVQEALDSVYLHRLRTPEDRAAVLGLMRAIGLRGAGAAVRTSGPQDARA